MDSSSNDKKRKLRRILVLPDYDNEDGADFSIDKDDYLVVREFLSDERKIRRHVKIDEKDEERRVCSLDSDFASSDHEVPPSIQRLQHLAHLHCVWISSLPPSIGQLKNLKVLNITTNKTLNLPTEIGDLSSLAELNLTSCYHTLSLPSSIGRLRNLKKIILRDMISLKSLPEEIGDLSRLEEMDLGYSAIGLLPPSIGKLQNLKYLDLSNTSYLSNLPEEIGDLSSLKRLDLTKSSVTALPPSIGRLKNLEILLCSTQGYLTSLPEEIGNLASLKILDFATITIDAHRENFIVKNGRLQRIQELNLGYTQDLSKLPDVEERLDGGTIMDLLRQPSITSLPLSIGRLQNLEVLCLGSTKNLLNLPQEIGDLSSLKSLDLSGTGIASLPPSIEQLQNLEVLLLPNTKKLSNLPGEIGDLCSLKSLDLGGSTIASLPPSIGRLANLEILRLPHATNLPSLPEEISSLNKLKQVSRVGIDSSISSIPLFSGSRKSLQRFDFIESKCCKSPVLEEIIRGVGTNQWEFLLKQTQKFQFLGSLGWAINLERLKSSGVSNSNVPLVGNLFYTLACNRARARTRFGTTEGESMQPIPKLWPHLFHSPRRAFDNDEFVTEADAIYQLLIDGREHFVSTIMNRKTNGVSEMKKEA